MSSPSLSQIADDLIARHGPKARQRVIDEIVVAVRNHDIDSAKRWDEVGRIVDDRLAVPAGQLSFL